MKRELPNSASFLLSEDCNLACTYCFELSCRNTMAMTKEVAEQGLQYLSNNAIENRFDEFSVMLFGGEPLLNVDVLEYIFKRGLEIAKEKNIRFVANMVTNATIFNKRIENIFKKYGSAVELSIQLSVDGVKEVHDKYRITKGGKGSFDIIEKNVPKFLALRDHGISITIHGCSNKETLPRLFENYLFFREKWNFEYIWFMPIHSEEWEVSDVAIYEEELNKIADYVLERAKETGKTDEVKFYAPIDKCLSNYGRPNSPCGAGKNFVTITADGSIYPCHQFYFNDPQKHTIIGNIWDGVIEEKREIFFEYDCNDLSCLKKCGGNCEATGCYICIADNYNINGSIVSTVVGPRCAMSKVEKKIQDRVRMELDKMGLLKGNNKNASACECDSRGFAPSDSGDMPMDAREHACSNEGGCNCGEDKEFQKSLLTDMASSIVDIGEMLEKVVKQNKDLKNELDKVKKEVKFIGRKI